MKQIIGIVSFLGLISIAHSQVFVEASNSTQKIGMQFNNIRVFLGGDIVISSASYYNENMVEVGGDYLIPKNDYNVGVRIFSNYGLGNSISEGLSAGVAGIAEKNFGNLTMGGGLGPKLSFETGRMNIFNSLLFVRLSF